MLDLINILQKSTKKFGYFFNLRMPEFLKFNGNAPFFFIFLVFSSDTIKVDKIIVKW